MSSQSQALPGVARSKALDNAGAWFWQFLKTELAPYPGRAWVVGRITIAATITMILVMTFRIPYGFLGAIFTLFLSRENFSVTFRAGVRLVGVYVVATLYTVVGIMTMVDDPLTHFLWIAISLFLAFYLIHIMPDYGTAVGFGFTLAVFSVVSLGLLVNVLACTLMLPVFLLWSVPEFVKVATEK